MFKYIFSQQNMVGKIYFLSQKYGGENIFKYIFSPQNTVVKKNI